MPIRILTAFIGAPPTTAAHALYVHVLDATCLAATGTPDSTHTPDLPVRVFAVDATVITDPATGRTRLLIGTGTGARDVPPLPALPTTHRRSMAAWRT